MPLTTPLYETHLRLQGKMVDFGGYLLPVQYPTGIINEHHIVRNEVGLFDVCHMAEIWVEGPQALTFLNTLLTNEFSSMSRGKMKYTLMCYPNGTVVDDLLAYKFSDERFLLVCNADNHQKDYEWMVKHQIDGVKIIDASEKTGLIALQGPQAENVLSQLVDISNLPEDYYTFRDQVVIDGITCLISRNGYTGEDGFEIATSSNEIEQLYLKLIDAGAKPCGLGARDTLRLEAGMPLYGHELSNTINPYEARLGMFVKLDKPNFIGKDALKDKPKAKVRVGLKMLDRGIGRQGSDIYIDDTKIGEITSGTQLPTVGYAGAMGYVNPDFSELGTQVTVDVRGRRLAAQIIKLPFYKREK